jgi:hypothetical protein
MDREGEAPAEPKPTHRVGVRRRPRGDASGGRRAKARLGSAGASASQSQDRSKSYSPIAARYASTTS